MEHVEDDGPILRHHHRRQHRLLADQLRLAAAARTEYAAGQRSKNRILPFKKS